MAISVGNVEISAYGVTRVLLFGGLLFWLGRSSNAIGQDIIRNHKSLDVSTKEVFAKLFEVALFCVVFLLLLNVMGINLTALAVFGGAVGVGLGLGLQSIASNFISGIIILLDKSLTVGDYVELEDGQKGIVREFKMRYAVLETYDGKDVLVPNEKFISSLLINWTHKNQKQRYNPISIKEDKRIFRELQSKYRNSCWFWNSRKAFCKSRNNAQNKKSEKQIIPFSFRNINECCRSSIRRNNQLKKRPPNSCSKRSTYRKKSWNASCKTNWKKAR